MNRKKIIIVAVLLFVACSLFAQTADEIYELYSNGNESFDAGDYDSALSYYERILPYYEKNYGVNHVNTADMYSFIGTAYFRKKDWDNALFYLERALAIYEFSQEYAASAAGSYYKIGSVYFNKSEYDTALLYYKKAIETYESNDIENRDTTVFYYQIASAYYAKGEYGEALQWSQKDVALTQKLFGESSLQAATSYKFIGQCNFRLGNYQEAEHNLLKAVEVRKSVLGSRSPEVAMCYMDLANIYLDMELYGIAFENCCAAYDIFSSAMYEDEPEMAFLWNDFGRYYYETNGFGEALDCYEKSLDIMRKVYGETNENTAREYENISMVYHAMGDYSRARSILENALEINKSIFGAAHPQIAECYKSMGVLYRSAGDYDSALSCFKRAADQVVQFCGETHLRVAYAYEEIGNAYSLKGGYEEALAYYRKALAIVDEIYEGGTLFMAQLYNDVAFVYGRMHCDEDGIAFGESALDIYKRLVGEQNALTAGQYVSLGWLYAGMGETDAAINCFKKSFLGFSVSKNYGQILINLNNIIKYANTLSFGTQLFFIRETLEVAADTVERARLDMSSMKSDILRKSLPIYYYGVDFEARNGNPAKAFEYAEMLRSRGFLDDVGLERAVSLDGVTDEERKQIKELSAQIAFARKEIENQNSLELKDRDTQKFTQAEKDLAAAEKSLAKLDASIGKRLPQYAQLRNPQAVSAKAAQKWCGNDRAVLEYVFQNQDMAEDGDSENGQESELKSYCLVITKQNVTAVPLDGGFDYAAAVTKLRENVIPKNARAKPTPEVVFEDVRNELYEKLIEPVMPYIKGKGRLLIVPDGCLSFLPFDILRKSEDAKMLCERYAVSLSPSVSVSMISGSSQTKGLSMLAFGGAWYDSELSVEEHRRTFSESDTNRGRKRGFQAVSFDLDIKNEAQKSFIFQDIQDNGPSEYFRQKNLRWMDLPGTIVELNTLKDNVFKEKGYEQYVHEDAAEHTVKQLSKNGVLATYPVLHFACHGYFDKSIATMSSILFSEVSGKLDGVSSDDGYLTIPEVSLLNLDADLVCLSACETGLGEVRVGDGMIGLNRAFMVAGARRVGVTLWSVDDGATAEFMASMYKKAERNGIDYEQAYRRTKAEFQKSEGYSHPYYWAAFALYE